MRKIAHVLFSMVLVCFLTVINVLAVNYTDGNFSVEIPSELNSDESLADEYGLDMVWVSEDELFEFYVSVEPNTQGYSYVNYDEDDFQNLYEDYIEGIEYDCKLNSGKNIKVDGFEGVEIDLSIDLVITTVRHIVYAFSTESEIYTLSFYIYDDAYNCYVDEIVNTISIDGLNYNPKFDYVIEIILTGLCFGVARYFFKAISDKLSSRKINKRNRSEFNITHTDK